MNINSFPKPPINNTPMSYTSDGKVIPTEVYQPGQVSLGANFSGLIGNQVTVPTVPVTDQIIKADKKRGSKKKKENADGTTSIVVSGDNSPEVVNPKEIVETTVYADTYLTTNQMTYGIIQQSDDLLNDCRQELNLIRSQRSMKGRNHYINETISAMSSLLSTKLAAVKEINNTIKNVNDNEYRRFKDMRAIDATDDNKAIMDAYTAFISAPVGAPEYKLPGTASLTGGLNGIIRADYPANVQQNIDMGMANYMANMSPEENLMLVDSNPNIKEVLVYDQATGSKRFQWMNTQTGEYVNNLPPSSDLVLEDYVIDPVKKIAKNINLNDIKQVVILNEGSFDKF